ncbi:hypothetical protein K435DRAFT_835415 [Dendrothele bispora CBS 962.96]|uniref:Uncharacterized protein n=1 Tax=Dendrothele bispora (strain CBS 962.96) TaxID=1314807 RepID=A0A4S8MMZ6_DENBC|nr:hypothetical protein K435DRAFT_835415 [Dendrothele bispora CBS 962.96]
MVEKLKNWLDTAHPACNPGRGGGSSSCFMDTPDDIIEDFKNWLDTAHPTYNPGHGGRMDTLADFLEEIMSWLDDLYAMDNRLGYPPWTYFLLYWIACIDKTITGHDHDTVVNIDLDLYSPRAGAERPDSSSQQYGSTSERYTEQDNRRIERNVENVGTYYEGSYTEIKIVNNNGNLKAFCTGGLLTGSGFYVGHSTTIQVEVPVNTYELEPVLLGNNALAVIYPRSMDQVPAFLLTFMIVPTVMGNLFSFIRHTIFGRVS